MKKNEWMSIVFGAMITLFVLSALTWGSAVVFAACGGHSSDCGGTCIFNGGTNACQGKCATGKENCGSCKCSVNSTTSPSDCMCK